MGNEASKDGSGFPSPQVVNTSSSNKRSRVSDDVVEGGPAVVEMTSISSKSKSKEEAPGKPKTQKQLNEELNSFKCINSSCCKDQGGCFLRNFCSSDQSCILMDNNAINVLHLFREKTRILTKEEEGELALSLFKAKCSNLATVVSPTEMESTFLFGEDHGTSN